MMKVRSVFALLVAFGAISVCSAAEQSIVLASTTSVEASGSRSTWSRRARPFGEYSSAVHGKDWQLNPTTNRVE